MTKTSRSNNRTIFITGTSAGIGSAAAKLFAERGWNVAATMREPSNAPVWANRGNVEIIALDVSNRASISAAIAAATGRFGQIDVLLNNAGYGLNGPVEGATDDQMRRQFDVNFFGLIDVTTAVLPQMRARKTGLILNVSSIGGLIGFPSAPLYIASKHAVEGLVESWRYELKPHGIRMKLIEPGGIKTDFIKRSSEWTVHADYAVQIAAMKEMTKGLDNSLADPADVASVILKAAQDGSDRLRYLAKPGPYVMLNRLLPDRMWRGMIQFALDRRAGTR
jgi:NAD(P)-dependent dehydrogenase (short-subunit alcohol dehydrogenase family)